MAKQDKLVSRAQEHLEPGEEILFSVLGTYECKLMGNDSVRSGVLIATDRRLVFYAKKMTGYELESFPYRTLSSFDAGKNMMGHNITFYASGNKAHVKWMKEDIKELVSIVREKMHAEQHASAPAAAPAAPQDGDPAAALQKITALKEQGLITAEEFDAKRAEIIARL